jgi:hypothetical protein
MKKIISYEEFKSSPRLFKISNKEIKSDYKKIEEQRQYLILKKRHNSAFKKKKFDLANSIKEEMNKLIGTKE